MHSDLFCVRPLPCNIISGNAVKNKQQLLNSNATLTQLKQLYFTMVSTKAVAKKGPTFGHVAKKGPTFWSKIPEGSAVRLRVTRANPKNRREWRLLFSHLSLLRIFHFLTLSCQVGAPLLQRMTTSGRFSSNNSSHQHARRF